MIKSMDLEYMFTQIKLDMKGSGQMIFKMERDSKYGLMDRDMMEIILKARNMAMVKLNSQMAHNILESLI